jgi:hypothetical protein
MPPRFRDGRAGRRTATAGRTVDEAYRWRLHPGRPHRVAAQEPVQLLLASVANLLTVATWRASWSVLPPPTQPVAATLPARRPPPLRAAGTSWTTRASRLAWPMAASAGARLARANGGGPDRGRPVWRRDVDSPKHGKPRPAPLPDRQRVRGHRPAGSQHAIGAATGLLTPGTHRAPTSQSRAGGGRREWRLLPAHGYRFVVVSSLLHCLNCSISACWASMISWASRLTSGSDPSRSSVVAISMAPS